LSLIRSIHPPGAQAEAFVYPLASALSLPSHLAVSE